MSTQCCLQTGLENNPLIQRKSVAGWGYDIPWMRELMVSVTETAKTKSWQIWNSSESAKHTLQERCCHSPALRVTLQRESELACILGMCWRFRVFYSKQNVIFFHFQAYFLNVPILITPIKWPNVSRMCLRHKTSSKLCSFSNNNNNNSLYFQRVTHLAKYKLIFHEALYY